MTALIRYEAARTALAEAHRVDEVKDIRDKAQAMAAYAKQAGDTELVWLASEIKIRAERKCGELLAQTAQTGERAAQGRPANGDSVSRLSDLGISAKQSERYQKLAAVPADQFEQAVAAAKEVVGEVTTAHMLRVAAGVHVANNSGNNEWYTPPELTDAAREVMGAIDLDPASSEVANRTVRANHFYTALDNGLAMPWVGRIWLNPPYAQPLVSEFVEAVVTKYEAGEYEQACVLVNNATETGWFQRLIEVARLVCFLRSRVKFLDATGRPANSPLQGQAVIYIGQRGAKFQETFREFGAVLRT